MYCQRDEENYIIPYFGNNQGNFLDIGAYHPKTFSNTRALFEMGWNGAFIEPSKNLWEAFEVEYAEEFRIGRLELHKIAIDEQDGQKTFYDSRGDAVSSFSEAMVRRWGITPETYEVQALTIESFLKLTKFDKFEFVNIDTEGLGIEILRQIPFDQLGVKMVCIEFDDKLQQIQGYLLSNGFRKIHQTSENLICVK